MNKQEIKRCSVCKEHLLTEYSAICPNCRNTVCTKCCGEKDYICQNCGEQLQLMS
ncbi:MAG: hypothetical protein PHW00_03915 [Clostridia bacterium]|nr:hypothetical protein [Clostridia bacterium]